MTIHDVAMAKFLEGWVVIRRSMAIRREVSEDGALTVGGLRVGGYTLVYVPWETLVFGYADAARATHFLVQIDEPEAFSGIPVGSK